MIALALCEIGSLAERRIAMLVDPALSRPAGVPDAEARAQLRLHDPAGDRRGAGLREQAARLSGQRRFDPDLGQPGGPCLDGGARRAPPARRWPSNAAHVVGIELLAAAQGCDFHAPLRSSAPLERVRAPCCAPRVPHLDDDRYSPRTSQAADGASARCAAPPPRSALVRRSARDRLSATVMRGPPARICTPGDASR